MVRLLTEEGGFSTEDGLLNVVSGVLSHFISSSDNDDEADDVFF